MSCEALVSLKDRQELPLTVQELLLTAQELLLTVQAPTSGQPFFVLTLIISSLREAP